MLKQTKEALFRQIKGNKRASLFMEELGLQHTTAVEDYDTLYSMNVQPYYIECNPDGTQLDYFFKINDKKFYLFSYTNINPAVTYVLTWLHTNNLIQIENFTKLQSKGNIIMQDALSFLYQTLVQKFNINFTKFTIDKYQCLRIKPTKASYGMDIIDKSPSPEYGITSGSYYLISALGKNANTTYAQCNHMNLPKLNISNASNAYWTLKEYDTLVPAGIDYLHFSVMRTLGFRCLLYTNDGKVIGPEKRTLIDFNKVNPVHSITQQGSIIYNNGVPYIPDAEDIVYRQNTQCYTRNEVTVYLKKYHQSIGEFIGHWRTDQPELDDWQTAAHKIHNIERNKDRTIYTMPTLYRQHVRLISALTGNTNPRDFINETARAKYLDYNGKSATYICLSELLKSYPEIPSYVLTQGYNPDPKTAAGYVDVFLHTYYIDNCTTTIRRQYHATKR